MSECSTMGHDKVGAVAVVRLYDCDCGDRGDCVGHPYCDDCATSLDGADNVVIERFSDEIAVPGHKVYVTRENNTIVLGAVNDERPLVRMTFRLGIDDAEEIITMLREAVDGYH